MEPSLTAAEEYKGRAVKAISEAKLHLENGFFETAVSTAYYACFYAVNARLARLGIEASSHKQVGIQFRRFFIRTKRLPAHFSETWQQLFKWRMEVDYAPVPRVDRARATQLLGLAEEFVTQTLAIA